MKLPCCCRRNFNELNGSLKTRWHKHQSSTNRIKIWHELVQNVNISHHPQGFIWLGTMHTYNFSKRQTKMHADKVTSKPRNKQKPSRVWQTSANKFGIIFEISNQDKQSSNLDFWKVLCKWETIAWNLKQTQRQTKYQIVSYNSTHRTQME